MENNNTRKDNYFETMIIGAGPAGLIAGWYLDNALILDKKQEIGAPVNCGEGISRKALERQGIKPDNSWISAAIDSVQTIMPNGKSFGGFHKGAGYVIDRTKFEKFLASKCQAKIQLNTKVVDIRPIETPKSAKQSPCPAEGARPQGARPRKSPCCFQITTDQGETFKSKYIIGADGPNSIVRKKFFQEKINFVPAIEYSVKLEKPVETNIIKIFFDNEKYPDGYAWIFPKSKNLANIGLGGNGNLTRAFNEFLENTIKPNYGTCELLENKSGIIPFDNIKISDNRNIMLAGDAAGLIDPILKGGMNQAMRSGRIAAQCVLNNEIHLYESKIKSLPSANPELFKANKILCSLSKESLNELGEIMNRASENKTSEFSTAVQSAARILKNPVARKDTLKLLKLFSIYNKTKNTFF